MLISGRSPLPTLAVFIGVLGGLAAFGLIGLFVGPIVIALVLALIEFAKRKEALTVTRGRVPFSEKGASPFSVESALPCPTTTCSRR